MAKADTKESNILQPDDVKPTGVAPDGKRPAFRLFGGVWGVTAVLLLRLVVGGIFVFSGFVKAIDPWGSIYKFGEYLNVLGFNDLEGLLLFMAVAVASVEFLLGVFVLLGIYRRFAPWAMALMMTVMLPLTLYIAITDKVADCGCFGDAVVLSNWATFWKNVALTLGIAYLVAFNRRVKNVYGFAVQWMVVLFSLVYALLIAFAGYYYQPMLDFRPFPVGSKIEQESMAEDAGDEGYNFVFVYEKDGVKRDFGIDSLPDDTWTFVDRRLKENPPVASGESEYHIALLDKDYEPADSVIVSEGEQMLFLFPNMKEVGVSYTYLINEIYDYAQAHGISVIGMTSASDAEIAEWNDLSMASYELYHVDDSMLKMIARGNPAVVYLKDGKVVWKRTLQSISMELISQSRDMESVARDFDAKRWLSALTFLYAVMMILLLIVNRTHLLLKIRRKSNAKKAKTVSKKENKA